MKRFEFSEHMDLSEFLEKPGSCPAAYTLQAVLVHSGTTYGGHYTAYISPQADGRWYHFDDECVYRASKEAAIDSNFGSDVRVFVIVSCVCDCVCVCKKFKGKRHRV